MQDDKSKLVQAQKEAMLKLRESIEEAKPELFSSMQEEGYDLKDITASWYEALPAIERALRDELIRRVQARVDKRAAQAHEGNVVPTTGMGK